MTTTTDIDSLDFPPSLSFWGGPLDGVELAEKETHLPNRERKLFKHSIEGCVLHDPDGPSQTIYYYCAYHGRMEPLKPGQEYRAQGLEPPADV